MDCEYPPLFYGQLETLEILVARTVAVENLKLSLLGVHGVGIGVKELEGCWCEGEGDGL